MAIDGGSAGCWRKIDAAFHRPHSPTNQAVEIQTSRSSRVSCFRVVVVVRYTHWWESDVDPKIGDTVDVFVGIEPHSGHVTEFPDGVISQIAGNEVTVTSGDRSHVIAIQKLTPHGEGKWRIMLSDFQAS